MELTTDLNNILQQWNQAKEELKKWKELEGDLRDILVDHLFNKELTEGTESIDLANGWILKTTKKLSYKLDNAQGEVAAFCASLPDSLSKALVRWKPELSIATFRKLDPHTKKQIESILSVESSKPSLELIPPAPP